MPDYGGRLARLAIDAFRRPGRASWRAQLTSATVLDQIRHPDERVPAFTFNEIEVASANDLVRLAELTRSPRERRADPGELPAVAQTYGDLAARLDQGDPRRIELLALAASTWSIAGYQANAAALAKEYKTEINAQLGAAPTGAVVTAAAAPAAIAALVAAVLLRDVNEVGRLGAMAATAVPELGRRFVFEAGDEPLDPADAAVLAAYGLAGRATRGLSRCWRLGDVSAGNRAVVDLRQAAGLMIDARVVDTWALLDNLAHVVEDIVSTSPWRLLRRAGSWNARWEKYLRSLAVADDPVVQVWPSQQRVLNARLLAADHPHLAITMPTSAGKTNVAEWAILEALADRAMHTIRPLVVYVVPSRALAGELERHLARTLGNVGLTVSGLFGGAEHVQYELRLIETTDVLVATSEKFDLLLRNDDRIAERLALVVADEGHLLGEGERGLRLELVLTRVRQVVPTARVLVLSAVLPNPEHIAAWIDPTLAGSNVVAVDWSPSRLRVGVFQWRGREEDGQHGVIQYRDNDVDHSFFLPYVITRHRKRTRLYPTAKTDIAAELALHYERLGPVLIAAPRKISARAAAKAVLSACRTHNVAFGVDEDGAVPVSIANQRQHVVAAVAEFGGENHELVAMARAGIAYHHADVPEMVRRAVEDAYRAGAIRILCATSTLGLGVNLPAKSVIVSGTWRNQDDELPVRDFWNIAGRAARPFRETDGHVILVADNASEATRLRNRYVENPKKEPVRSTLFSLYISLLARRLGKLPKRGAEIPADLDFADPVDVKIVGWAEALDLQLLTLLAEEVVDTADEQVLLDAVASVIGVTLGGVQLQAINAPLAPLARFAAHRARAVATRVPDRALRRVFVRTGLSLGGCESALAAADAVMAALNAEPDLLTTARWSDLLAIVLTHAVKVREVDCSCQQARVSVDAVPALAAGWVEGKAMDVLREEHGSAMGTTDAMVFARVVDRIVVNDLAWVVSAIIELINHRRDTPLSGPITAAPAMLKYGVPTETACYAASVGVRRRPDAIALGRAFPTTFGISFRMFLGWIATLRPEELEHTVSSDTAALFLDRAAALLTPDEALNLTVNGQGTVYAPLRGIRHARSASVVRGVPIGGDLQLAREYENPSDPNAVAVLSPDGDRLGYVAREVARVLAPLLDMEDGPVMAATLVARPADDVDDLTVERHDVVRIQISVSAEA